MVTAAAFVGEAADADTLIVAKDKNVRVELTGPAPTATGYGTRFTVDNLGPIVISAGNHSATRTVKLFPLNGAAADADLPIAFTASLWVMCSFNGSLPDCGSCGDWRPDRCY